MIGVQELLLALFVSAVFILVLGTSQLIFSFGELSWLKRERDRIAEDELSLPEAERLSTDESPERERFENSVVNYHRSMRICNAELVVGLVFLAITVFIGSATVQVDAAIVAGVVFAVVLICAFWGYALSEQTTFRYSLGRARTAKPGD